MANEWQRIAIRPNDYQKLKVLTALSNINRGKEDQLPMADYFGDVLDEAWKRAKANGWVSDAMLTLDEAVETFSTDPEPVYEELEAGA